MTVMEVASAEQPSSRQKLFLRYFTAILVNLAVLNLFDEHWQHVVIGSFTVSLAVAIFLHVLLKLTLKLEHWVADYFANQPWKASRFLRAASAALILFVSKFVILGLVNLTFGDQVLFAGPLHGVVAFIAVIATMLAAEEVVVRFYRRLAISA